MASGASRESMHVTIAIPAWAMPSKPAMSKSSAYSRLAAMRSSKSPTGRNASGCAGASRGQPTERSASAVSIERVATPRKSSSASTPAATAQNTAPRKMVCSWAMPAAFCRSR